MNKVFLSALSRVVDSVDSEVNQENTPNIIRKKLEVFLERFPKDATSWEYATDEVRDLARATREFIEDLDNVTVEPVDFREIDTPAEWNTRGRDFIMETFDKMTPRTQEKFYERVGYQFDPEVRDSAQRGGRVSDADLDRGITPKSEVAKVEALFRAYKQAYEQADALVQKDPKNHRLLWERENALREFSQKIEQLIESKRQ